MKKLFTLLVLFVSSQSLWAQQSPTDSLLKLLNSKTSDTNRINNLIEIGRLLDFTMAKGDSSKKYLDEAERLSKKIGNTRLETISAYYRASHLYRRANYPEALIVSLGNLKKLEQIKQVQNISYNFAEDRDLLFYQTRLLSFIYARIGDSQKQLTYIKKIQTYYNASLANVDSLNNYALTIYYNFANAYQSLKMFDSSHYYRSLVYNEASRTGEPQWLALSSNSLGKFYADQDKIDTAMKLFRQSIPAAIKSGRIDVHVSSELNIGKLFQKKGQMDSAFFYSLKALNQLTTLDNPTDLLDAYEQISHLYRDTKQPDSAYKYLQNFISLKDSLNDQTKLTEAQNFAFNQTLLAQQVEQAKKEARQQNASRIKLYALLVIIAFVLLVSLLLMRNLRNKRAANNLLTKQKTEIESNLSALKATQAQLIQAEKMASLGELTAGIAHEIQNPLNFVNNFSEINKELIEELKSHPAFNETILKIRQLDELVNDIASNEEKINQHGKRADAIVKGMLQHSRTSAGQKELTDINVLCDEYLRLSYHGLRAKDKNFNASLKTDFDNTIGKINIISQDIGRVILNLITNAFYAVDEKKKQVVEEYEPTVSITTKNINNVIEIKVADNGNGIPATIIDKVFQPFFTTKPTGQGTGLGLSMSYDIIKAHGGELKVETKAAEDNPDNFGIDERSPKIIGKDEGTTFIISLPVQ